MTEREKDIAYLVARCINSGKITFTDIKSCTTDKNNYLDYFLGNPDLFRVIENKNSILPTEKLIEIHRQILNR